MSLPTTEEIARRLGALIVAQPMGTSLDQAVTALAREVQSMLQSYGEERAREADDRVKRAERELRELARVGDTLSPQEIINHCAAGLGVDRHEYPGDARLANRSVIDLDIQARAHAAEVARLKDELDATARDLREALQQAFDCARTQHKMAHPGENADPPYPPNSLFREISEAVADTAEAARRFEERVRAEARREGEAEMRERAASAANIFPIGSAHTCGSENADLYRAQENCCECIVKAIRALPLTGEGTET